MALSTNLQIRPVYIGAAEYAAGAFVPLEQEIVSQDICDRLRAPTHGANTIPLWEREPVELAAAAIERCLLSSGRHARDIDAIFILSNGLDANNNLNATWLKELNRKFDLTKAVHYQTGMTGCAGFHWAAKLAAGLIASQQCNNVLIVSFDKAGGPLQRLYDETTDFPYITGDAAAACLVSDSSESLGYQLTGRIVNIWDSEQASHPSFDSEMRCIARLFQETYKYADLSPRDVSLLITNNYSLNVSKLYCQLADLSYTKAFTDTISSHAHCFSSDNIINLHYVHNSERARDGQHLMLFSAGLFQWGACILEKLPGLK